MSPASAARVRYLLRTKTIVELEQLARTAIGLDDLEEIEALIGSLTRKAEVPQ